MNVAVPLIYSETTQTENLLSLNSQENNSHFDDSSAPILEEKLKSGGSYSVNLSSEISDAPENDLSTKEILMSFTEFQNGEISDVDADVSNLLFNIMKLGLDGNGSKVLPSLELLGFLQKTIDSSKYNTVTTLDFILTFFSKDKFYSSITHDLKELKTFSDYLSYLMKNSRRGIGINIDIIENYRLNKELLASIRMDVYSAIWNLEELIKVNGLMDYEQQNLNGTTVYSTQPIIGRIKNDIYTNKPRVVFSYRYTKEVLKSILGSNLSKLGNKLKRVYNKMTFPLNKTGKNKRLSPQLINVISMSARMLNDLYNEGFSSNTLSPGFILMLILREDIDFLSEDWFKNLVESNIPFGNSESEIKIQNHQDSTNLEIIHNGDSKKSDSCNHSLLGSKIRELFKEYGIEFFEFVNKLLNKYKTSFQPPKNKLHGYLEPRRYFTTRSIDGSRSTATLKKIWFSDITQLVLDGAIDGVIERLDLSISLEQSLSRSGASSIIIIGSSVIAKRILVENLSYRIINGKSSNILRGYRVIIIDLVSLLETCNNSKKNIVEQVKTKLDDLIAMYDGKVILFIEEVNLFLNIEYSGNNVNLATILAPAILNGSLKVIGTSKNETFKQIVKKDPNISLLFESIEMPESCGTATEILLMSLRHKIELSTGIFINSDAIRVAVKLCIKYIPGCLLPETPTEIINSAITIAKSEIFMKFPTALNVLEDSIRQCKTGIQTSNIRDYEISRIVSNNRDIIVYLLKKYLRKRNQLISVSLKIDPYLAKFRSLENQLYFFTLITTKYGVVCRESESFEQEMKILEEREKIIPNFSDKMSIKQLTNLYRKNLLNYKHENNLLDDEAISKDIGVITESQLRNDLFDNNNSYIKERQRELSELRSLILEMSMNYQSPYSPLGMGEIDASHIAYVISEKVNISMRVLLDEIGYRKLPEDMRIRVSEVLSKYVVGQKEAVDFVSLKLSLRNEQRKTNSPKSFLFAGPGGTGKKTFAHALHIAEREQNIFMHTLSYDATEFSYFRIFEAADFSDKDAASRLVGEIPKTGLIAETIKHAFNVVFLFNLIEKMHPSVIDLIAKILQNKDNFNSNLGLMGSNTFIITSNIGAEIITNNSNEIDSYMTRISVIKELQKKIGQDLVSGVENIVLFKPYDNEEITRILEINLSQYALNLKSKYNLTFLIPSASILKEIVEKNYSKESGSEAIFVHIDKFVKEKIKELITNKKLKSGNTFRMTINKKDISSGDSEPQPYNFVIVKNH